MANGSTEIAKFYASLGIKTNKAELNKVDAFLKTISERFKKSKNLLNLEKFAVNQQALNRTLGTALDVASRSVTFEISRFVVNERNLQAALIKGSRSVSRSLPPTSANNSSSVPHSMVASSNSGRTTAAAAAGFGISRLYAPALALAAGGYGLSALNKRNQAVVAAQLQSNATVSLAGGNDQQGQDSFNWLRYQGNRIGFNYLDASQDYNTLLSNFIGSGMSVKQGQGVFKGFSEYARTMKLGPVQQKRVFKALSDISGKGQLQAQELKLQLGQALPGAESLFAQAYQNQLKATGKGKGDLTGQEAMTALLAAMKKGDVKSSVLTYAGDLASARAAPTLAKASQASVAEQGRYQNSITDLAVIASKSGVEEGFSRIFRTLNDGLEGAGPLVEKLAKGFNQATKDFRVLALIPGDIDRLLQGKDSFFTRIIGEDKAKEIRDLATQITTFGQNFNTLTDNIARGWTLIFEKMNAINDMTLTKMMAKQLGIVNNVVGATNSAADGDYSGAGSQLGQAAKGYFQTLTTIPRGILDFAGSQLGLRDDSVSNLLGLDGKPSVASSMLNNPQAANNTVTISIGDVNIRSSASDLTGVSTDIQAQMKDAFQNAWSEASMNYTKAGR